MSGMDCKKCGSWTNQHESGLCGLCELDVLRARVAELQTKLTEANIAWAEQVARVAELEGFAFYVMDHSNDPAVVFNAKRVLGKIKP